MDFSHQTMSSETPCPSKSWLSPALLLTAVKEATTRTHEAPRDSDWRSPSLFLAAAASISRSHTSLPLSNGMLSELLMEPISTPWPASTVNPPTLAGPSSTGNTPRLPSTPFLGQPSCPNPILFSPIRESSKKIMSHSPQLEQTLVYDSPSQPPLTNGQVYRTKPNNSLTELSLDHTTNTQNHEIPSSMDGRANQAGEIISRLNQNDVLFGKGHHRSVNTEFRRLLALHSLEYITKSTKEEKDVIVRRIVDTIKSKGGRFVKKVSDGNNYMALVDEHEIRSKILSALEYFNQKPKSMDLEKSNFPIERTNKSVPALTGTDATANGRIWGLASQSKNLSDFTGSHPGELIEVTDSLAFNVHHRRLCHQPKKETKRKTLVSSAAPPVKRSKKGKIIPAKHGSAPKHQTIAEKESFVATLPKQLDGVRVSKTNKGTFEARYKAKGEGKKAFPKYIASAPDRATAVWLGNVVARLLKEDTSMDFDAAKKEAIWRYKQLGEREKETPAALQDNLLQSVADELVHEDQIAHKTATAATIFVPENAENIVNL